MRTSQTNNLEGAVQGDLEAFEALYHSTISRVYRTVYLLCRNTTDVEDIVQNVYFELYRNLSRYDPSRPFQPWLSGIVINQVRSYQRQKWRQSRISKRVVECMLYENEEDHANEIAARESLQTLMTYLDQLPDKIKQVVILRYVNGHSQEEVSEILNIPLGTVKSRLHAALSKLRKVPVIAMKGEYLS